MSVSDMKGVKTQHIIAGAYLYATSIVLIGACSSAGVWVFTRHSAIRRCRTTIWWHSTRHLFLFQYLCANPWKSTVQSCI